jgi:hypothetical protein
LNNGGWILLFPRAVKTSFLSTLKEEFELGEQEQFCLQNFHEIIHGLSISGNYRK